MMMGSVSTRVRLSMATMYTVYFAGALFTHKDLLGNDQLAAAIEEVSAGQYVCVLPQHSAQTAVPAVDIRDQNLKHLMTCDLALFNFDGTELDSGTVVEFMFAKFLDIPAVLLRTDFRAAGDQQENGDAWNLMCSFYPRTTVVQLNAIAWYQQTWNASSAWQDLTQQFCRKIATAVIEGFEAVRTETPLAHSSQLDIAQVYQWALRFPRRHVADSGSEAAFITQLVTAKRQKHLL
jgi:nucleoside 2-deoxyribosyltransferase